MRGRHGHAEPPPAPAAAAPRRKRRPVRPVGSEADEPQVVEAPPEKRPRATVAGQGPEGAASRPRLHIGRLSLLVLVLIAAAFYLGPLRAFFAQQDRYQQATTALEAAKAENVELKHQIALLGKDSYIAQQALAGSRLVEPGTQVFVIKGLPGRAEEDAARGETPPEAASISVLDRLEDLWRTLKK